MAIQLRTAEQFIAWAVGIARSQVTNGIHPEAAIRFGIVSAILVALGRPVPAMVSGLRTLARQRELWELNRRFPNARDARPVAERSWHTEGLALDIDANSPSTPLFEALWRAMGGRVGRDFRTPDPGHLDFPIQTIIPRSIFE